VVPGSTRATAVFFTNFGVAYTARLTDLPASTGYGEPIQSLFKFKDGEKVVGALSLDPRVSGVISAANPETPPPVHALAVSSDGYSLRFSLQNFLEPSTRAGRKFANASLGQQLAPGRKVNAGTASRLDAVDSSSRDIRAHHHACPAPGRRIVHGAVLAEAEGADVDRLQLPDSLFQGRPNDGNPEQTRKGLGEKRENCGAKAHGSRCYHPAASDCSFVCE